MPHPNPALDRTGTPQNFRTQVAAKMNWLKRCAMGAKGTLDTHSNYLWIKAHPEFLTSLTMAQRVALRDIEHQSAMIRGELDNLLEAIEKFNYAEKVPSPKSERRKAVRKAKNANPSDEKP